MGFWKAYLCRIRGILKGGDEPGCDLQEWLKTTLLKETDVSTRLRGLSTRLGLDSFDRHVLLLATAAALDAELRREIAAFRRNLLWEAVDVDLAIRLWEGQDIDARLRALRRFFADAPLVRHGLVRISTPPDALVRGLATRVIDVSDSVAGFLLLHDGPPPSLARFAVIETPSVKLYDLVIPESVARRIHDSMACFRSRPDNSRCGPILVVRGPPGCGKTSLARATAHLAGIPIVRSDLRAVASARRPAEVLDEVFSFATVQGTCLLLEYASDSLSSGSPLVPVVARRAGELPAPLIIEASSEAILDEGVEGMAERVIRLRPADPATREDIWVRHLPDDVPVRDDIDLASLASEFDVSGRDVARTIRIAAETAVRSGSALTTELLRSVAVEELRADAGSWTTRRSSRATLDDLILPDSSQKELRNLLNAARNRPGVLSRWGFGGMLEGGRGLCSLFVGESGTGKTFAALLLANELDVPLLQVSLGQITSKYVGETEKRIDEVLESARSSHSILLFDEADALFTRRVSVENANDRYSNLETNHLLQAIDQFDGVVILTTNLESNMDPAFRRRIQFVVRFPLPGPTERAAIWRRLLPDAVPIDANVDFLALGRDFELSGGQIKNAVLRAAYEAYGSGCPLRESTLRSAANAEYAAAGRVVRVEPRPDSWR